jgi:hypothetical protein
LPGGIDLAKIRRNWEDILRVVASIYTGTVRAYDVVTMLQRDGHPTALGEAIASYGRIFKSLHILSYIDTDESYGRDIKGIRNLQGWAIPSARGSNEARSTASLAAQLEAIAARLSGVYIECADALDLIQRHAGPDALIYADPPYLRETRMACSDPAAATITTRPSKAITVTSLRRSAPARPRRWCPATTTRCTVSSTRDGIAQKSASPNPAPTMAPAGAGTSPS